MIRSTPTSNFYKVEQWSRDGRHIDRMVYAGNDLDRAREIFEGLTKRRPRGEYTIRQGIRVLAKWPR
jgi:hypothetical protein